MRTISEVVAEARRKVAPSKDDTSRLTAEADSLLARTRKAAAKYPQTRGALLGGSFAKGTWLPGHVDLDIFVKFDPSTLEPVFEKVGLEIGNLSTRGFPRGKKFAQHPYTEAVIRDLKVNIVPCYDVARGEWKSAADRSPFHVKLVEGLPEESKSEVRLLKSFMHGIGVYGAEIERRGFSGYVAEVLVMKHNDFQGVLSWFASYPPFAQPRPFSLPDPVDEGRDLGIAVSGESLGRMVLASREFLRRPATTYFRGMPGTHRPALRKDVVALVFRHPRLTEDTLWGELRRTMKHIVRHLEVRGFKVVRSMAASDNDSRSAVLLIPEFTELPPTEQRVGPTVDRRKDVEAFMSTNSKDSLLVWVDDDARVRLLRPRAYIRLADLLRDVSRGRAGPVGASKELEKGMRKSATVLQGPGLSRAASSLKWLQEGIREITSDAVGTR